jgi:hypothetical protein
MKWVTYDAGDGLRTGIVRNDTIHGLRAGDDRELAEQIRHGQREI